MVFDLDVLVCEEGGLRLNGLHWSGEVEEGVDGVDGLIHQAAASIKGLRATPGCRVVVGLIAIPFDVGRSRGEGAEAIVVCRLFKGVHPGMETPVEDCS